METIRVKRGDRSPSIAATLKQGRPPTVIDLTGCTVAVFARNGVTGVMEIDGGIATVVTAIDGTVRYDFAAGDVDTVGIYDWEWEITLPSGKKTTVPNDGWDRLYVLEDLG